MRIHDGASIDILADELRVGSGLTLGYTADGTPYLTAASQGTASIYAREADGSPNAQVDTLEFPNGSLSITSGVATITFPSVSTTLASLTDTTISSPVTRHALVHNGTAWVNRLLDAADIASGTFGVARGGTGRSTLDANSYLVGNGTSQVTLRTPAQVLADIGAAAAGHTHALTDASITGVLPIAKGGTNATTVAGARTSLSVYSTSETDLAISAAVTNLNAANITTGILHPHRGGTGYGSGTIADNAVLVGGGDTWVQRTPSLTVDGQRHYLAAVRASGVTTVGWEAISAVPSSPGTGYTLVSATQGAQWAQTATNYVTGIAVTDGTTDGPISQVGSVGAVTLGYRQAWWDARYSALGHGHGWGDITGTFPQSLLNAGQQRIGPRTSGGGSIDIWGADAGTAGVHFVDFWRAFYVSGTSQGIFDTSGVVGWQWRWDNGVLAAGAVPWSLVSSKPDHLMYYAGFTLDADTMPANSTGFTYSSNAPWSGPIVRFSAGGGYDMQMHMAYYGDGSLLALRARNGDNGTWHQWWGLRLSALTRVNGVPSPYGSVSIAGSAGGYAGINFSDMGWTFMVDTQGESGVWSPGYSWRWRFDGTGTLQSGTVPAARVSAGTFGAGNYAVTGSVTAATFYKSI